METYSISTMKYIRFVLRVIVLYMLAILLAGYYCYYKTGPEEKAPALFILLVIGVVISVIQLVFLRVAEVPQCVSFSDNEITIVSRFFFNKYMHHIPYSCIIVYYNQKGRLSSFRVGKESFNFDPLLWNKIQRLQLMQSANKHAIPRKQIKAKFP